MAGLVRGTVAIHTRTAGTRPVEAGSMPARDRARHPSERGALDVVLARIL